MGILGILIFFKFLKVKKKKNNKKNIIKKIITGIREK